MIFPEESDRFGTTEQGRCLFIGDDRETVLFPSLANLNALEKKLK